MQIMEKNGRDGDDLSCGWLEVKKKHRPNTKFSVPKSVGTSRVRPEPSRKTQQEFTKSKILVLRQVESSSCNKPLSQENPPKTKHIGGDVLDTKTKRENKHSDTRVQVQNLQASEENAAKETVGDHSLQFGEIEPPLQAADGSFEKLELKDMGGLKICVTESSVGDSSNIVNCEITSSLAQVPKIKWGNLEEEELKGTQSIEIGNELAKPQNLESGYKPEDKMPLVVGDVCIASTENGLLVDRYSRVREEKEEIGFSNIFCASSKMLREEMEKENVMESIVDLSGKSETCDEQHNQKSVDVKEFYKAEEDESVQYEIAKEDECGNKSLLIPDEVEAVPCQDPNPSCMDDYHDSVETTISRKLSVAPGDIQESISSVDNIHDYHDSAETTISNKLSVAPGEIQESISSVDNINGYESKESSSECETLTAAEEKIITKDTAQLEEPKEIASVNEPADREKFNEDRSMAENLLINAFGKGKTGESKERFRERLWCFLFENLNRAIDELYLLCELECDVEQMKEAVVVLEEAQSDFRELKGRVDGFDKVKEASSAPETLSNGTPVNATLEHRRPHALSWEVRRMASSPRRAEILSSSLAAFKKIQEESATKNTGRQGKRRDAAYPALAQSRRENLPGKSPWGRDLTPTSKDAKLKGKQVNNSDSVNRGLMGERKHNEMMKSSKENTSEARIVQKNVHSTFPQLVGKKEGNATTSHASSSCSKVESLRPISEMEPINPRKIKLPLIENRADKSNKVVDPFRRHPAIVEKEKDRKASMTKTSLDAWKEKRNWEDILVSPLRNSSRTSHSPIISRKSTERARVLHDKLMSPERRRKSPLDMKKETDEKHARATKIRRELENERQQRLQRESEKLNRVSEWQAVRSSKLREGMHARQQRGESRHEAYLAQIARRASDESNKVSEVRFITSLNEENKKLSLRQKLQDSELRRAERLQIIKIKQKEDIAREEAVLERRKLLEAEKLQRLAETQRKKEEAQARREEERKAASAAREAKAVEQLRKKEVRAKAQREEAEIQAQKLAERLSESELRRKIYLEQIREKAAMDFREQASPLSRRPPSRDGQPNAVTGSIGFTLSSCSSVSQQQSFKKRVKKIRQKLMSLKYEFVEPPVGTESAGLGTMAMAGAARSKIGRWLQDLQRLQQARKAGYTSIGLIIGEMIKYLEGKEAELHAARQAGLLDFIASALPASHTSKPEACQTTISLLRIMKVVLTLAANRSYFLARNFLPPLIPMLSTALENYCTIAASNNNYGGMSGNTIGMAMDKVFDEKLETIGEVLEGLLWSVAAITGHTCSDERQLQMQDDLVELIVASKVIHNLHDLFSLFDRPPIEGAPFPAPVLLGLNLLRILTCPRGNISFKVWEACSAPMVMVPTMETFESADQGSLVSLEDSSSNRCSEKESECHPSRQTPKGHTLISDVISIEKEEAKNELPNVDGSRLNNAVCEDGEDIKHFESLERSPKKVSLASDAAGERMNSSNLQKKDDGNPIGQSVIEPNNPPSPNGGDQKGLVRNKSDKTMREISNRSVAFLVSVIAETGLVGLPSLLTAVLLQANPRNSEQAAYMLPANFEEVATGVLKIMNNLARLDLTLVQSMLARPDLQMEFFHLMSFLLSHCTCKWKNATDQVALLLFETLLLLGYFALNHSGNQAVLRWGKSPTILHKICDLPFAFFSDPQLTPILVGTLLAVCYGCEQNRDVVQQELSMDMLLVLLKSSKQDLYAASDAKQTVNPRVGIQLNVQSNSISYQSGMMDVITEESEEEMQKVLENETALNSQGALRKPSRDSLVVDIPVLSQQQPGGKPNKTSLMSDHAKKSNRIISKTVPQGDNSLKESLSTRTGTLGKAVKGKMVSTNKEIITNQSKVSKTSNSDGIQKVSTPGSSKRVGSAVLPDHKTNLSSGIHSQGLKVTKEYEENPLLSPAFMLQNRFPVNLIDHAQEFFAAGLD